MRLSETLDLVHACGYVTILNPYKEEVHDDDIEGEQFVHENPAAKSALSNLSILNASHNPPATDFPPNSTLNDIQPLLEQSGSDAQTLDLPQNGFKDQHSADVLNSELDDLENATLVDDPDVSILKNNLHLDVKRCDLRQHLGIVFGRSTDVIKEDEWVLLDLCYGLPLFNTALNKDVCSRISKLGLFKQERYEI